MTTAGSIGPNSHLNRPGRRIAANPQMQSSDVKNAFQIRLILAPVDGSDSADKSARVALELAQKYHAKIVALSIVSSPGFALTGPAGAPADLTDYYKEGTTSARKAIDSIMQLAKEAGVEARGEVLEPVSSTVGVIVEFAEKEQVDLIVMGTRGLGGFKKLLLGSVSSGVVSNAPCSVLIVR
jgi:nucleotide-binding universal stress UspA family protein